MSNPTLDEIIIGIEAAHQLSPDYPSVLVGMVMAYNMDIILEALREKAAREKVAENIERLEASLSRVYGSPVELRPLLKDMKP